MGSQHRAFETNTTYPYAKEQVRRVALDLETFTLVQIRRSVPQCNSRYIDRAIRELREEGVIQYSTGRNAQSRPRLYRVCTEADA